MPITTYDFLLKHDPPNSILLFHKMPVWSSLSAELTDTIIDFIADSDPQNLAACSLVCKTVLPRVRFHLFHSVKLLPSNVAVFLKLFHSPTKATIIPYIHTLSYGYIFLPSPSYRFYSVPLHGAYPSPRVRSFVEIIQRLPPLPSVTDLTLTGVVLGAGLPKIAEIFPNLSRLHFTNVDFRPGVMNNTICPVINTDITMTISSIVTTDTITPDCLLPSARNPRFMRLSSFRWSELCDTYLWLSSLRLQPYRLELSSVSLFCTGCRDYTFLLRFLRFFGDELVDLALNEESYLATVVDPIGK